ncbi:MAG TPA: dUTP diphosphatase [Candidatus Anoxymicrobiaceae bacterium]|jgi:dUTP pyrophosphatase
MRGQSQPGLTVSFKRMHPEVAIPEYAHDGDAGCDLRSMCDVELRPGERALVPTGIAMSIPEGYAGFVQPRSGLAAKHGISIVNTPGLIDSHYRGEIKVILINTDAEASFEVKRGDKVCQLVFQKVEQARFVEVDELDETVRGAGGFGSTGV